MKKTVIILIIVVLATWAIVLGIAIFATHSTDIIGSADWPTFYFKLTECLHSPFGIFVQILTIVAVIFWVALAVKIVLQIKRK